MPFKKCKQSNSNAGKTPNTILTWLPVLDILKRKKGTQKSAGTTKEHGENQSDKKTTKPSGLFCLKKKKTN